MQRGSASEVGLPGGSSSSSGTVGRWTLLLLDPSAASQGRVRQEHLGKAERDICDLGVC